VRGPGIWKEAAAGAIAVLPCRWGGDL